MHVSIEMKTGCLTHIFFVGTKGADNVIQELFFLVGLSLRWCPGGRDCNLVNVKNRYIQMQVQQPYNSCKTILRAQNLSLQQEMIDCLFNLEYNSAHVVVAGPQLVLCPHQGLKRRLDEVVHAIDVLLQRPGCVGHLPVLHEVEPAVKEGFQIVKG